ncbi:uncharacterized protein [Rutidosis leptorrhynchoides]|uniref:uncharacterized protein n=1 Tax=Rutidosis leptorrhynchoides TaxID=125765 RepID=UPI003A99CB5A
MAEIVLTATVTVLLENLLSGKLIKLTGFVGIESQLKDLQTNWKYIDAVLADASEKQITDRSVNVWLQDFHDLAYDMEDVLDDMATETMRRKMNDESHGSTSTGEVSVFNNFVSSFKANIADNYDNLIYAHKMRSMLNEINNKLEFFVKKAKDLGIGIHAIAQHRSNNNFKRQ